MTDYSQSDLRTSKGPTETSMQQDPSNTSATAKENPDNFIVEMSGGLPNEKGDGKDEREESLMAVGGPQQDFDREFQGREPAQSHTSCEVLRD